MSPSLYLARTSPASNPLFVQLPYFLLFLEPSAVFGVNTTPGAAVFQHLDLGIFFPVLIGEGLAGHLIHDHIGQLDTNGTTRYGVDAHNLQRPFATTWQNTRKLNLTAFFVFALTNVDAQTAVFGRGPGEAAKTPGSGGSVRFLIDPQEGEFILGGDGRNVPPVLVVVSANKGGFKLVVCAVDGLFFFFFFLFAHLFRVRLPALWYSVGSGGRVPVLGALSAEQAILEWPGPREWDFGPVGGAPWNGLRAQAETVL